MAVLLGAAAAPLHAAEGFPKPTGYVNDFAGVLRPDEAGGLEATLKELEGRTSAQVAVVTVPDLGGYADVEEYSVELFKAWGIGQKGQDNGVLVLLAMKEKKARIEVGYGLEGAITDGASGLIIRNTMAPYFRNGEYGRGLIAGVDEIAKRIPPGGVKKPARFGHRQFSYILYALFLILVFSQFFFRGPTIMGGGRRRYYGGGPFIGGFGGGFGGGGFFGGGGGFGGGFGGFGGGGSGGGGASGGW